MKKVVASKGFPLFASDAVTIFFQMQCLHAQTEISFCQQE